MDNKSYASNFKAIEPLKLKEILESAVGNAYSDFYRRRYKSQTPFHIGSLEDFQKIPFLNKDEFLSVPLDDRLFIPKDQIGYYSFSSGTTKRLVPTIMAHGPIDNGPTRKYLFNQELFSRLGVTKVMLLLQPTAGVLRRALSLPEPPAKFINGDIRNLPIMAMVMKEMAADGIMTTPTILDFLISELDNIKFDLSTIRWISIGSEFCSTLRYEYFRSKFKNAYFHIRYGNSEIGGSRHFRCPHLAKNGPPNQFHIDSTAELIEIIDDSGNPVSFGESGEIVHTDMKPKAFPLIRYRVGDIGSLSDKPCSCGESITLTVEGRAGHDVLKIHGTVLHAELIAQAVGKAADFVEPRSQLHVYEKISGGKPKLFLEMHLKLRGLTMLDAISQEILKEKISANLMLSGRMTLKEFADKGIILPLELVFVDHWEQNGAKAKNIISHLD